MPDARRRGDRRLRRVPRPQRPARAARARSRPTTAIAHAFQRARACRPRSLGDLRALVERGARAARRALLEPARGRARPAVRRRLRDEDDPQQPARRRTRASASSSRRSSSSTRRTFFAAARAYRRAAGELPERGEDGGRSSRRSSAAATATRFYPDVSGVARSYNFYPLGPAAPRGRRRRPRRSASARRSSTAASCWTYSPAHPRVGAAVRLARATCSRQTQTTFWAVNMGPPPAYDPIAETEYLVRGGPRGRRGGRHAALRRLDLRRRRPTGSWPGTGRPRPARARLRAAARVRTSCRSTPLLRALLRGLRGGARRAGRDRVRADAAAGRARPRFGFLQVRPMRRLATRRSTIGRTRAGRRRRARRLASAPSATAVDERPRRRLRRARRASRPGTRRRSPPRSSGSTARLRRRGPALPADRLRPLGQLATPGSGSRCAGTRSPAPAASSRRRCPQMNRRAEPGLALLPQPVELPRPLLHRAPRPRPGDRLGLARAAGDRRPRPPTCGTCAPPGRSCSRSTAARGAASRCGRRGMSVPATSRPRARRAADKPIDRILHDLQERAKELNCLYRVDELLGREEASLDDVLGEVIRTLPAGWQYPGRLRGPHHARQPRLRAARASRRRRVRLRRAHRGAGRGRRADRGLLHRGDAALPTRGRSSQEERKLIDTIAERIGHFLSRRRLQRVLRSAHAGRGRRRRSGGSSSTSCARPTARCSAGSAAR